MGKKIDKVLNPPELDSSIAETSFHQTQPPEDNDQDCGEQPEEPKHPEKRRRTERKDRKNKKKKHKKSSRPIPTSESSYSESGSSFFSSDSYDS